MKNVISSLLIASTLISVSPFVVFASNDSSGSGSSGSGSSTSTPKPSETPHASETPRTETARPEKTAKPNETVRPAGLLRRVEDNKMMKEQELNDDKGGLRNASRSALIEKRGEIRDEFKTKLEEAKQEWKDKRAALIENLKKIKDEKKVEIVENVDARLADRNAHWVEHWTNVLTRHSELLDKIQSKATELEGQGKDITSVTSAIAAARSAITTAQAKVTEQAGKTYTIPVTTEATLGANVSATVKQMQADVKSVITLIEAVRKATQSAISALKTVAGVASSPVPSPTVQP